ncbi:MAG: hypothetical protein M1839_006853 [Geoglossum umbratile]|nr:MAG: hypothetical protein M1839_006853 [Geoglossum umbratile]
MATSTAVSHIAFDYPAQNVSSASVPASATATSQPPAHRRVYQACIPCRRRKVRCDLGSVDSPHDPPCVRCRRESKDCYFSATRRKRKPADDGEGEYEDGVDEYEIRNGRKRLRGSSDDTTSPARAGRQSSVSSFPLAPPSTYASPLPAALPQQPLTPGGSVVRNQPLRRPASDAQPPLPPQQPQNNGTSHAHPYPSPAELKRSGSTDAGEEDQHLTNSTAEALLHTEVYNGHDALNLLFEAAGQSGDIGHRRVGSQSSTNPPQAAVPTPGSYSASPIVGSDSRATGVVAGIGNSRTMPPPRPVPRDPPIDPALTSDGGALVQGSEGMADQSSGLRDALGAWSKFRFVRAGWFTAREAISYIEYFYTYLAPLSPIMPPPFRAPPTHPTLLAEEPILTLTLLTISSRYMSIPGPGNVSRSFAIHEKLWGYLRGMIERMVWGQEQFGGGFCGAGGDEDGDVQSSSTAPWRGLRKGSLRTLGTVEGLMLLTEWHPRALHFPPGDDAHELIIRDGANSNPFNTDTVDGDGGGNERRTFEGIGGRRIENWLEPAWRSDRMCWMLLGNALALSFELGVFDDIDDTTSFGGEMYRPEFESELYRYRAHRVQKLLLVYVTQLSGRLGWTNMVPRHISKTAFFKTPGQSFGEGQQAHKDGLLGTGDEAEDIMAAWIELTTLLKSGNELLFPSRKQTRELIRSGRYVGMLEHFQPLLRSWRHDFEKLNIPTHMRHILNIEYEYLRVYINSLALQAVVERCTNNASNNSYIQTTNPTSAGGTISPNTRGYGSVPFSTLITLYGGDQEYVKEVVDASRSLLQTVVEGLLPGDYLKHAPVRTYFRIISGAMFLLKRRLRSLTWQYFQTFALGAKEDEVAISLSLMDRAINALRTCIVDDVHLGNRFADLLDTLTQRIRARFVRMAGIHGTGASRRDSHSPAPNAGRHQTPQRYQPTHGLPQPSYQQWNGGSYDVNSNFGGNTGANGIDGQTTPNPLLGISTESIDVVDPNVSIMPPPSFVFTPSYENGGATTASSGAAMDTNNQTYFALEENTYNPDWLALPLDNLLNASYDGGVTQTEVGPDVGGYDLLEILLGEMESGVGI